LVKANHTIFGFISLTILIAGGVGITGRRIRTSRTKVKYLCLWIGKQSKLQSECRICRYLEPEMSIVYWSYWAKNWKCDWEV